MKSWFPEEAREPGDIDFVVVPPTLRLDSSAGDRFLESVVETILDADFDEGLRLLPREIRSDVIWNYERAPGRRFVVPWQGEGLPSGTLQIDVVFSDPLPDEGAMVDTVSLLDGSRVSLLTASPGVSLAWKIQWLLTDQYPQGKDLYDAALIARRFPLSWTMLQQRLELSDLSWKGRSVKLSDIESLEVDWDNFQAEYPWVQGSETLWRNRLVTAVSTSHPSDRPM